MSYTAKDLNPLVRGDDWSIKLTITENSLPVNITGYTYWLTLKSDIDSVDPGQLQISTVATSPNSISGIVYINVPHASTNITAQTYNYDVQQVNTSSPSIVKTILMGKVKVVKDVTRSS